MHNLWSITPQQRRQEYTKVKDTLFNKCCQKNRTTTYKRMKHCSRDLRHCNQTRKETNIIQTRRGKIRLSLFVDNMIVVVQQLSLVQLFATPWTAAYETSLSFTIPQNLLKCMSIETVMSSNHLIFCHLFHFLASIFPSIRVFSNESALCIRSSKYWRFSFSISPSNEYPGLISFRTDWFDLLAVQGTLRSLLQHHNLKASILGCSAFFHVNACI